MLKTIWIELISRHYNDFLVDKFGIIKPWKLIAQKYYWPMLQVDVEAYVKGSDICLISKIFCSKHYGNLWLLQILIHQYKNLSMNFVISLPILTNWKNKTYNSIFIIVNRPIKMIYYKAVKIIIDASSLMKVIINVVMRHYSFLDFIISNCGSVFTSNFWSLLCYFLVI